MRAAAQCIDTVKLINLSVQLFCSQHPTKFNLIWLPMLNICVVSFGIWRKIGVTLNVGVCCINDCCWVTKAKKRLKYTRKREQKIIEGKKDWKRPLFSNFFFLYVGKAWMSIRGVTSFQQKQRRSLKYRLFMNILTVHNKVKFLLFML